MSVKRRTDTGRWEVRWREGSRNRSRSFRSKRDADAFWHEVERRKQMGQLATFTAGDQTLGELVEQWWRDYAIPNLAENTRKTYGAVWHRHAFPRLADFKLRDLTTRELERFRAELAVEGVGEPTILKTLTMLQAVCTAAVRWDLMQNNPVRNVAKPSQKPTRQVEPVHPVYVEALIGHFATSGRARDALMVSILAYAGLRPGELLALRWGHVGARSLRISSAVALGSEKTTKTGVARSVRLLAPLGRDLENYRDVFGPFPPDRLVFPSGFSGDLWQDDDWRNWRRRVFRPAAEAVGLSKPRPYDLRHSFVSLLIHEGVSIVEVAAQAGHSPQTCLSRYAHVFAEFDPTDRRPAADVIEEARAAAHVRATYAAGEVEDLRDSPESPQPLEALHRTRTDDPFLTMEVLYQLS